jgi:hypothetical protein
MYRITPLSSLYLLNKLQRKAQLQLCYLNEISVCTYLLHFCKLEQHCISFSVYRLQLKRKPHKKTVIKLYYIRTLKNIVTKGTKALTLQSTGMFSTANLNS